MSLKLLLKKWWRELRKVRLGRKLTPNDYRRQTKPVETIKSSDIIGGF